MGVDDRREWRGASLLFFTDTDNAGVCCGVSSGVGVGFGGVGFCIWFGVGFGGVGFGGVGFGGVGFCIWFGVGFDGCVGIGLSVCMDCLGVFDCVGCCLTSVCVSVTELELELELELEETSGGTLVVTRGSGVVVGGVAGVVVGGASMLSREGVRSLSCSSMDDEENEAVRSGRAIAVSVACGVVGWVLAFGASSPPDSSDEDEAEAELELVGSGCCCGGRFADLFLGIVEAGR